MNTWSFFERRVCLTLGPDWPKAQEEFARVGLMDVQPFMALPIDGEIIKGPHQSFSASVRAILSAVSDWDSENLLLLEDDCIFRPLDHLEAAIAELSEPWDVLYLGANLSNGSPERFSEHLFRVRAAWTTHAICFHRRVVAQLLAGQPPLDAEMFDTFLGRQLPDLQAFIVAPMVAYQRPHRSAIWNTDEEDYSPIFLASDEKLR